MARPGGGTLWVKPFSTLLINSRPAIWTTRFSMLILLDSHYYVDSVRYEGKWHFWQHTDIGSVPGIHHDVDLNVFNGSLEELRKMTMR